MRVQARIFRNLSKFLSVSAIPKSEGYKVFRCLIRGRRDLLPQVGGLVAEKLFIASFSKRPAWSGTPLAMVGL